jgi:hypothetical protein
MMLIEALKTLRVLEKRIADNSAKIQLYASSVTTERPVFGSDDEQKREVQSLCQANEDLVENYIKLSERIERTNLGTSIVIAGRVMSLQKALLLKRKLGKLLRSTYTALNDSQGRAKLNQASGGRQLVSVQTGPSNAAQLELYYDEAQKNKRVRDIDDMLADIDAKLEVINATTELLD